MQTYRPHDKTVEDGECEGRPGNLVSSKDGDSLAVAHICQRSALQHFVLYTPRPQLVGWLAGPCQVLLWPQLEISWKRSEKRS